MSVVLIKHRRGKWPRNAGGLPFGRHGQEVNGVGGSGETLGAAEGRSRAMDSGFSLPGKGQAKYEIVPKTTIQHLKEFSMLHTPFHLHTKLE